MHQALLREFNARRQNLIETAQKADEMQQEVLEHENVIKALQPMDTGRRCFRLVGEVMVERTVGETLPAVIKNKESLENIVNKLRESAREQEQLLQAFQVRRSPAAWLGLMLVHVAMGGQQPAHTLCCVGPLTSVNAHWAVHLPHA